MIDSRTGSILLDNGNIVLNSKIAPNELMATSLYKGGSVDPNYLLKDTQEINGKIFLLTLFFKGKLKEIHLSEADKELSWENWSEEKEMKKKESHDKWLLSVLGQEPYQYTWGQVESVFDKKGCVSSIILRYL
ncbi:hypothetical protein MW695_21110 [Alkalihalobacillus sp. APA_J-10(15)]|nr:hypothetical protein [Halalkalibacter sp. APA_J-10(15)]